MYVKLLDYGAIAFIFFNVLAFDFPIAGIPVRYILLVCMFLVTLCIKLDKSTQRAIYSFFVKVIIAYSLLISYSLIKGNDFQNVKLFITPLFIFLMIPTYAYLIKRNGVERYLNTFVFSNACLIVFFIYLLYRTIQDPGWGMRFGDSDSQALVTVVVYDRLPRIIIKTFVFLVPAASYLLFKFDGVKMHLCFFVLLILSLISQTFGVTIGVIFVYLVVLLKKRKRKVLASYTVLAIIIGGLYFGVVADSLMENKEGSVGEKQEQVMNLSKDMGALDYLFGRGLGVEFVNFDARKCKDTYLEVAAVQIFQSCGLFFSLLFFVAYLFPAITLLRKANNNTEYGLSYAQIGLIVSSLTNPYMWSGGVGLLFIVLIVAYLSVKKTSLKSI